MKNHKPILVQKTGKESGDIWFLTGYWDGEENKTGSWVYDYIYEDRPWRHIIPFNFGFLDGASAPRITRPIIKLGGRECPDEAWIPHDHAYHCMRNLGYMPKGTLYKWDGKTWRAVHKVSKEQVDKVFRNELLNPDHGLSEHKAPWAYRAVKWFGPKWKI